MEDMSDFPGFGVKRRAVARPTSLSGVTMDMHIDPVLASMSNSRRKQSGTSERPDDFVLVTPRSEFGSWPSALTNAALDAAAVGSGSIAPSILTTDGSSTTGGLTTSSVASHWMLGGTGDLDTQDVSHLATVHFPELRDLPSIGENGSPVAVPNLDFLSFGGGGEEWRDWGGNGDGMGDSSNGYGTGLPETPGSVRMAGF
jgi:hypothetical protein